MKICKKCQIEIPLSAFRLRKGKTVTASSYHNSICRNCEREDRRIWLECNRERQKQSTLKWRKKNPEKYAAQRKRNYEKHKEKIKDRSRKHYYDNHEQNLIRKSKYAKSNRHKRNEWQRLDYRKNKKRHLERSNIKATKSRIELKSAYLRKLLKEQGWPLEYINSPIIQIKKLSLLTKRKIKELC